MGDAADDYCDSLERRAWTQGDREEEPSFDALTHAEELGVIKFVDGAWWRLKSGARREPLSEREAYDVALLFLSDEERAYAALITRTTPAQTDQNADEVEQ